MNLILFKESFKEKQLLFSDPRAQHILKILKLKKGDKCFVGFLNGKRCIAEISEVSPDNYVNIIILGREDSFPKIPVTVLLGMPRPSIAKRILYEASCFGVSSLHFFNSDKSELSYSKSSLWGKSKYSDYLYKGAEQSFSTQIPKVNIHKNLSCALEEISKNSLSIILDNYTSKLSLGNHVKYYKKNLVKNQKIAIAFGPERGWSRNELEIFKDSDWRFAHLGARVLRLESAFVAALGIISDRFEFWPSATESKLIHLYN